jgi:hypothetical protein
MISRWLVLVDRARQPSSRVRGHACVRVRACAGVCECVCGIILQFNGLSRFKCSFVHLSDLPGVQPIKYILRNVFR